MPKAMNMRRDLGIVALLIGLATATCPAAAAQEAWPLRVQRQMARVSEVGWRLADAAAALCHDRAAPIGAQLDHIRAYSPADRPQAAASLGLGEAPMVSSVVPGSPAATAGLQPGDEIVAVNGQTWQAIAKGLANPDLLADELQALIASVPVEQPLVLTVRRAGASFEIPVARRERCAARFVLKTGGGLEAHSDAANVAIADRLVDFARTDDELALVLGHELAHVLYRDRRGMPLRARRQAEARADLAGALLARCAGYDLKRALELLRRLGRRDWLGGIGAPAHGGMKRRAERLAPLAASDATLRCPLQSLPADADEPHPGSGEQGRLGLVSPAAHARSWLAMARRGTEAGS